MISLFDNQITEVSNLIINREKSLPDNWNSTLDMLRRDFIDKIIRFKSPKNVNIEEDKILFKYLSINKLLLKPADKNLGWVLMDQSWYREQSYKHLNDKKVYIRRECPTILVLKEELANLIRTYHCSSKDKTSIQIDEGFKLPEFYILPKVHKTPWASRPVVPNINSPTTNASRWLSDQLKPVLKLFPWILNGTKEMILYLESTVFDSILEPMLISGDCVSMYTNIPTNNAIRHFINFRTQYSLLVENKTITEQFPYPEKKWLFIVKLLEWVLKRNYFRFDNTTWLQIEGTAMGTNVAPDFAQIYLGIFEWRHIYIKKGQLPVGYKRYVDDTWMICNIHEIENTKQILRSFTKSFTWTFEKGIDISFLDLLTKIGSKFKRLQLVDIEPFEKALNTHLYTSPLQNYPNKYKFNWIQGEGIRLLRNSTDKKSFINAILEFKCNLLKRDYPLETIMKLLKQVKWEQRSAILTEKRKQPVPFKMIPIDYNPYWKLIEEAIESLIKFNEMEQYKTILRRGFNIQQVGNRVIRNTFAETLT